MSSISFTNFTRVWLQLYATVVYLMKHNSVSPLSRNPRTLSKRIKLLWYDQLFGNSKSCYHLNF